MRVEKMSIENFFHKMTEDMADGDKLVCYGDEDRVFDVYTPCGNIWLRYNEATETLEYY